jgi:hypothetical protein
MMMQTHCCTLRPFMPTALFCSFLYFCYVLDVCSEPPRTVIGVLFNPNLMKFGSFADMNMHDSSTLLVLTLITC